MKLFSGLISVIVSGLIDLKGQRFKGSLLLLYTSFRQIEIILDKKSINSYYNSCKKASIISSGMVSGSIFAKFFPEKIGKHPYSVVERILNSNFIIFQRQTSNLVIFLTVSQTDFPHQQTRNHKPRMAWQT